MANESKLRISPMLTQNKLNDSFVEIFCLSVNWFGHFFSDWSFACMLRFLILWVLFLWVFFSSLFSKEREKGGMWLGWEACG